MAHGTAVTGHAIPLVAGNWKMNTTIDDGVRLAEAVRLGTEGMDGVEVAVLPPFTHLRSVYEELRHSHVQLGAQDVFWETWGAYTGEVSPAMLASWCEHALVGHSERRHLLGETDEQVGRKLAALLDAGMHGIVAVGETDAERDRGDTFTVVDRQLDAAFSPLDRPPATERYVIAYEPVWAIGTGRTATPAQAEEVCAHIKEWLVQHAGAAPRVLYGGSVTPDNAAELFAEASIDGALVGGASLRAEQFTAIVAAAAPGARVG
jgi:triosephosphate isomerase